MTDLPEASTVKGGRFGDCWHHCPGRVYWPPAHVRAVVRCDDTIFGPHEGVTRPV